MLTSEMPCPTCGAPALVHDGQVNCMLCGGQAVPPQISREIAERVKRDCPETVYFELACEWLNKFPSQSDDQHARILGMIVHYLSGFLEESEKLPTIENHKSAGSETRFYNPPLKERALLEVMCNRFDVSAEELMSFGVPFYLSDSDRKDD